MKTILFVSLLSVASPLFASDAFLTGPSLSKRPDPVFGLADAGQDLSTLEGFAAGSYRTVFRVTRDLTLPGSAQQLDLTTIDSYFHAPNEGCSLFYNTAGRTMKLAAGTDIYLSAPVSISAVENPHFDEWITASPRIYQYTIDLISKGGMPFTLKCENYRMSGLEGGLEASRWRVADLTAVGTGPVLGFQIWVDTNAAVVQ